MLHPYFHAAQRPDHPAIIMASNGYTLTYRQLEERSNQGAHLFRRLGLQRGDHMALLMENHPAFFEICWAAQRAGIFYSPISYYLQPDEIEYIINNCQAKVFIASGKQKDKALAIKSKIPNVKQCYLTDGESDADKGFANWETTRNALSIEPIADQSEGREMLYSSGTTGKPKGIKFPLPAEGKLGEAQEVTRPLILTQMMGVTHETVALSTSPVYHSAPLGFVMGLIVSVAASSSWKSLMQKNPSS